jgi:hypothetical protein
MGDKSTVIITEMLRSIEYDQIERWFHESRLQMSKWPSGLSKTHILQSNPSRSPGRWIDGEIFTGRNPQA